MHHPLSSLPNLIDPHGIKLHLDLGRILLRRQNSLLNNFLGLRSVCELLLLLCVSDLFHITILIAP